ncbi:DUF2794 domain-containing protein [Brucellaceae bacterium D45D]
MSSSDAAKEESSHRSVSPNVIALNAARTTAAPTPAPTVSFDRHELGKILNIYGRMVASGIWRDYAIDLLNDRAVFSIFRRTSEVPLFRIEKNLKLANKQGAYSVIAASGLIMKRGHELERVLHVFDKSLKMIDN